MLRCKDGDEAAFEELVRGNVANVHGLVYRFLGPNAPVEDLTQEVFLRVYRTAPRYRPAAKFSTWLYRVVANLCFNVMRSRRRRHARQVELPSGQDQETFFAGLPDRRHKGPGHGLDHAELRKATAAAVDALPDNQKVAIILNKFEGKSYEDIATILGCSEMAVKSLLSRARRNLRDALGRYVLPD